MRMMSCGAYRVMRTELGHDSYVSRIVCTQTSADILFARPNSSKHLIVPDFPATKGYFATRIRIARTVHSYHSRYI